MKRARIYYHLSPVKGLNTIDPRLPEGVSPTEARVRRVCISSSIIGCIKGIQPIFGEQLYVYSVAIDDDTAFIPNKYVRHMVPDAHETGEAWVMDSTTACCEGRIVVTEGNGSYSWKWIEKLR